MDVISPFLRTQSLTKFFGDFAANRNITLSLKPGTIHAVVGENGAGKSTLMKMLFGLENPSAGQIFLDEKMVNWKSSMDAIAQGIGMVQQHFCLVETLSALDNIILGFEPIHGLHLDRAQAVSRLKAEIPESLHVPWLEKVENLSIGLQQRVEILKVLFRRARILILDEPTAVLTPQETREFLQTLQALKIQGRSILLITHKLKEVFQVADEFTVLRKGEVVANGKISDTSPRALAEHMIGRPLRKISMERKKPHSFVALELKNFSQDRGLLRNVSLSLNGGEVVGIAGVEGSGQKELFEELLRMSDKSIEKDLKNVSLLNHSLESLKTLSVRKLGVGLIPADRNREGLWLNENCYYNLIAGLEDQHQQFGFLDEERIHSHSESWSTQMDVRVANLSVAVKNLSGGNQQKIVLAREVLGRNPRLLLCHEPTRGVDIGAMEIIHNKILEMRNGGTAILLMSSDLDELLELSDRIYVLHSGKISGIFHRDHFDINEIGLAMAGGTT